MDRLRRSVDRVTNNVDLNVRRVGLLRTYVLFLLLLRVRFHVRRRLLIVSFQGAMELIRADRVLLVLSFRRRIMVSLNYSAYRVTEIEALLLTKEGSRPRTWCRGGRGFLRFVSTFTLSKHPVRCTSVASSK